MMLSSNRHLYIGLYIILKRMEAIVMLAQSKKTSVSVGMNVSRLAVLSCGYLDPLVGVLI